MRSKLVSVFSLGTAVVAVSLVGLGCGKGGLKSIVTDAKVRMYQVESDQFAEATVMLGTGNVQLPAFNYNIRHPRNANEILGVVAMKPGIQGGTEVDVTININKAIGTELIDPRLPNGNGLPIGGISNAVVVGIPVGEAVKVILGVGDKFALLGVTANIQQLDTLGRNGIPDLFIPFKAGNIPTTAGFYFSPTASRSGVGVFVDLSPVMFNQGQGQVMLARLASTQDTLMARAVRAKVTPVYAKSPISKRKESDLLTFLGKAHSKRQRFTLAK